MSTQLNPDSNSTGTEIESIPNPERGCGYLKPGKAYLRADMAPGGELPTFVTFDQPIPFKGDRKRSYKEFPGVQFELSVAGEGGMTETNPPGEIWKHLDRLSMDRPTKETADAMTAFHSHDLLLSVGKTHYPTIDSFVNEAKLHGVSKAISVTSGNAPPKINPGRTRLFLIHPQAVEIEKDGKTHTIPGVFGYTYLTRVVYTRPEDGHVPNYMTEYEQTGKLDVVDRGPEVPFGEQEDFTENGGLSALGKAKMSGGLDAEEIVSQLKKAESELRQFGERYEPAPSGEGFRERPVAALEAPNIEDMAKAEWSVLAESDEIEGKAPPKGQDALSGDEGGALAVVNMDNELLKIMPSNNLSVQDGRATSVVGPYRVSVIDYDMGRRNVEVSKTR